MSKLLVCLPHTPRDLSPNGRTHWARKATLTRRCRTMAWAHTMEVLKGRRFEASRYSVRWYYKGACPDADNVLARLKSYLDGACAAMGIDDRGLSVGSIDRIHDLGRAGNVEIVFETGGEQ